MAPAHLTWQRRLTRGDLRRSISGRYPGRHPWDLLNWSASRRGTIAVAATAHLIMHIARTQCICVAGGLTSFIDDAGTRRSLRRESHGGGRWSFVGRCHDRGGAHARRSMFRSRPSQRWITPPAASCRRPLSAWRRPAAQPPRRSSGSRPASGLHQCECSPA